MDRKTKFINELRYGGLTETEYMMCKPEILNRNADTLGWLLPVVVCFLIALLGLSCIPGSGEENNRTLYLVSSIIFLAQLLYFKKVLPTHPEQSMIGCYILLVCAFGLGIYESVFLGDETTVSIFCVFSVAAPMFLIDRPVKLVTLTILMEIILVALVFTVGVTAGGEKYAVIDSVCSVIIGLCCDVVVEKTKLSEIKNHLLLEKQRDTDILTGAWSRIAYTQDLEDIRKNRIPVGIVFADVNGLKQANDTYGHEVGDRLIRNAYTLLFTHFHGSDTKIYRIGGDEFVVITTCGDKECFQAHYEAMLNSPENQGIVSAGYMWFDKVIDTNQAIKQAETKMYEAKHDYYEKHPEKDRRKAQRK